MTSRGTGGPPGPSESLTSWLGGTEIVVFVGMSRPGRYRCVRAGKVWLNFGQSNDASAGAARGRG
jgi:hypothetical protein